jgi:hypothetical protein
VAAGRSWSKYPETPRGSVKGDIREDDGSLESLGNGAEASLSMPAGQNDSEGSLVIVGSRERMSLKAGGMWEESGSGWWRLWTK